MLVRDDDAGDVPGREAQTGKAHRGFAWIESTIEEYAGSGGLEYQAVALTAASERGKPGHPPRRAR